MQKNMKRASLTSARCAERSLIRRSSSRITSNTALKNRVSENSEVKFPLMTGENFSQG